MPTNNPLNPNGIVTPWSTVGYLTYARTYSRKKEDGSQENFEETIDRCLNACDSQLSCGFTPAERAEFRDLLLGLKCSFAGRFLWQLGTRTVDDLGMPSCSNCAFVAIDNPVRPFTWAFEALMLGCGVGFSVERRHVKKIPRVSKVFVTPTRIDTASADFIVPDTREGWVRLLGKMLKSAFIAKTKHTFTYSTQLIRGKGAPIKGFGGVASGPEILVDGVTRIGKILEARSGRKLRSIDCLDMMDIIGSIVVSGNIRRSALLALGDKEDAYFLAAKRWDLGQIPSHRAMSNNTVVSSSIEDLPELFWEGYKGVGEPYGIFNLDVARKYGRYGDTRYPDPNVVGVNPCCVPGEVEVFTDKGSIPIANLVGKKVNVWNGEEWAPVVPTLKGLDAALVQVVLADGRTLVCTPEHTFPLYFLPHGKDVLASANTLKPGEVIRNHALPDAGINKPFVRVVSVTPLDRRDTVYCFSEPKTGRGTFNGIVTGQSEQTLDNYETCALGTVNVPLVESQEELVKCYRYIYRAVKHSLALKCSLKETEAIVHKNMRMGLNANGYLQATEEQKQWLADSYEGLREYDVAYSAAHGFPPSIKLTTIQPGGTLSLLPGVTSGCHPGYAAYMIRRIQVAAGSPLIQTIRDHGYHVEYRQNFDGSLDYSTMVAEFPFKYADGTVLAEEMTAVKQMDVVRRLQREWSDNAVSVTVYYRKEELPEIRAYLEEHWHEMKAVSFLLHSDHGFLQAPFSEITKEQYDELVARTRLITSLDATPLDDGPDYSGECAGGSCPIR